MSERDLPRWTEGLLSGLPDGCAILGAKGDEVEITVPVAVNNPLEIVQALRRAGLSVVAQRTLSGKAQSVTHTIWTVKKASAFN